MYMMNVFLCSVVILSGFLCVANDLIPWWLLPLFFVAARVLWLAVQPRRVYAPARALHSRVPRPEDVLGFGDLHSKPPVSRAAANAPRAVAPPPLTIAIDEVPTTPECLPNLYFQQPFNSTMYEFRDYHCWKCQQAMIVFNWKGHLLYQQCPPPEPIPPSIQYRFSRSVRMKYWVNVCLECDAIQGDNFVFEEFNSPAWEYDFV